MSPDQLRVIVEGIGRGAKMTLLVPGQLVPRGTIDWLDGSKTIAMIHPTRGGVIYIDVEAVVGVEVRPVID